MNQKQKKDLKGCGVLIVIFLIIIIIIKSCSNNCRNCGGDGVIEVYGIKDGCPKCHPISRDWNNPK